MTNIQNEILNWIGNKAVIKDAFHNFVKMRVTR